MGNLAGKGEETKAMISTSQLINEGIQSVDKAQARIKQAQAGIPQED